MKPVDIDELRIRQEQRLLQPLQAWNDAKMQLENAIALAEARQQEYERIYDDVRQNLRTLDFVVTLAGGASGDQPGAPAAMPREVVRGGGHSPDRPVNAEDRSPKANPVAAPAEKAPATSADKDSVKLPGFVHRSSRPLFPLSIRSAVS